MPSIQGDSWRSIGRNAGEAGRITYTSFMRVPLLLLFSMVALQDDVSNLVRKLGSDEFETRNAAESKLVELGEKAKPALREALTSKDSEVSARARSALERIEWDEHIKSLPKIFPGVPATWFVEGKAIGTVTMKVFQKEGKLVLEDSWDYEWEGKKQSLKATHVCKSDRALALESVQVVQTQTPPYTWRAEIKDGMLITETQGKETSGEEWTKRKSKEISSTALTHFSLARLIGAFPRRKGFAFEFDLIEPFGINIHRNVKLTCGGEEEVEVGERKIKAWKWELSGTSRDVPEYKQYYWLIEGKVVGTPKGWVLEPSK